MAKSLLFLITLVITVIIQHNPQHLCSGQEVIPIGNLCKCLFNFVVHLCILGVEQGCVYAKMLFGDVSPSTKQL
jgi:hypothetical protein